MYFYFYKTHLRLSHKDQLANSALESNYSSSHAAHKRGQSAQSSWYTGILSDRLPLTSLNIFNTLFDKNTKRRNPASYSICPKFKSPAQPTHTVVFRDFTPEPSKQILGPFI
jgi:hypothetical protein